jgi:hypothetical protein
MAQPTAAETLVQHFCEVEERLLRDIEQMWTSARTDHDARLKAYYDLPPGSVSSPDLAPIYDMGWLSIARTNLQRAFTDLRRSIHPPVRLRLPEDLGGTPQANDGNPGLAAE